MYKDFNDFWDKKWENTKLIENNKFSIKVKDNFLDNKGIILDLGCGSGRDSLYFAGLGFNVEAFDFSKNALDRLKFFSEEKGFDIKTILGNTFDYNFEKDYYDIIYSCNSLHYFDEKETIRIIKKLKNSLKKGGYIFIRVKSINDTDYKKGQKISNNFYKNGDDIKYYFDIDFLSELFNDFEILEINYLQDIHNKIYGGTTINGFIDLVAVKK